MTFREMLLHKYAPVVLIAIVAVMIVVIIMQMTGGPKISPRPTKDNYSDDDGASYFVDDAEKITPFDHNGKMAVLASVSPGPDGKPHVNFLARHTEGARRVLEQARAKGERPEDVRPFMEFKKPGAPENAWVPDTDPRSQTIMGRSTQP